MTGREITRLVVKYLFDDIGFSEVKKLLNKEEMEFFLSELDRHNVYIIAPRGKAQ